MQSPNLILKMMTENKFGNLLVVDDENVLVGVISDGDIRRSILKESDNSLPDQIEAIMNKDFVVIQSSDVGKDIRHLFNERIHFIPVVDKARRPIALALPSYNELIISGRRISNVEPVFVIAEIGNNHNGSIELAKQLVDLAIRAGADCAKFQHRNISELYMKTGRDFASEDLGAQYTIELLNKYQLMDEQLFEIFDYCKLKGIIPLCTPWDLKSLESLETYGMNAYKLASADLTNTQLIDALIQTGKPLICSTGMSEEKEILEAVSKLQSSGANFALLHCNSTYPAPFKDINLNYINQLKKIGSGCVVGYSGHERGGSVAIAAVALGAKIIEKHFTIDREMEGNDHKVSLLPDEFERMVIGIREVEQSLGTSGERKITQGEMMNRENLSKSIISKNQISIGSRITYADLDYKSPGQGISPNKASQLVGRRANRNINVGDCFYESDLKDNIDLKNKFKFNRPFGIPVRYHDFSKLKDKANIDFVEFHLSYSDLSIEPSDYLEQPVDALQFAVHAPELFENEHLLNLATFDENYRQQSIKNVQRVIDITRDLNQKFFKDQKIPIIVVNAGGFSENGFLPKEQKVAMYELVDKSLNELDKNEVCLTIQSMPPFPWHFGGQRFHNLFADPAEIKEFCGTSGVGITLDTSHSQLYCNYNNLEIEELLKMIGTFVEYLHIADADGFDSEGLQIGDGSVNFRELSQILSKYCPDVPFIPEIWQGHKNEGEGFWKSLTLLEQYKF